MKEQPEEKPHWFQRVLDNPWLLLALGVLIPTISYSIWGWIELAMVPASPLK